MVEIKISGDTALEAYFQKSKGRLATMSDVLVRLEEVALTEIVHTLESGDLPADEPGTIENRERHGIQDRRPLMDTLDLFDSLSQPLESSQYAEFSASPFQVIMGTSAPGAAEAEDGTRAEKQRQFMPEEARMSTVIDSSGILENYADEVTR